jgi:hypothetical protein
MAADIGAGHCYLPSDAAIVKSVGAPNRLVSPLQPVTVTDFIAAAASKDAPSAAPGPPVVPEDASSENNQVGPSGSAAWPILSGQARRPLSKSGGRPGST